MLKYVEGHVARSSECTVLIPGHSLTSGHDLPGILLGYDDLAMRSKIVVVVVVVVVEVVVVVVVVV